MPELQMGIGLPQWTKVTTDLQTTTDGHIVQSAAALDDAATLDTYSGLWVDLGAVDGTLTATESANLQAYIQTGRRAVLIGENSNWSTWDASLLSAAGGSYTGGQYTGTTSTRSYLSLTTGVSSLNVVSAGIASSGTSLFQDRVATMWGPAQNAVVLLDSSCVSDLSLPMAGNTPFAANLTSWVAGGFGATDNWKSSIGGNWTASGSWSTSQMPSVADTAVFNLGRNGSTDSGYTVVVPSEKALTTLNVLGDKVTLALPAGPGLTVTNAINVAPPAGQSGALSLTRSSASGSAVVAAGSITLGGSSASTASLSVNTGVKLNAASALVNSGATLVQSGGSIQISGNITGGGSLAQTAGLTSTGSLRLNALTLTGGRVTIVPQSTPVADASVSVLNNLSFNDSTATFDLADSDLIVQNGDLATLTAELTSGYDGGKWDGVGIDSSAAAADPQHRTALGIVQNNDGSGHRLYGSGAPLGLFDGQDPALDAILIKYTDYGDADLSGTVNAADLTRDRLGAGGWSTGDFNYDGTVDASDLYLQTQALAAGSSTVPEPIFLPLVFVGVIGRRRRNS